MVATAAEPQIVVAVADQPHSPKRPSRTPKPSAKVREAMQSLEVATSTSRRATNNTTSSAVPKGTRALGNGSGSNDQAEAGKTVLQKLVRSAKNNLTDVLCSSRK